MASKVDIWNKALIHVGAEQVSSPQDDRPGAVIFSTIYDSVLKTLTQAHNWNFATKRASLAQVVPSPNHGFTYAYQIPAECIQVLKTDKVDTIWRREKDTIVTDEGTLKIEYLFTETNTEKFPPMFVELLSLLLATSGGYSLTKDINLIDSLIQRYERLLEKVKTRDAQESGGDKFLINTVINSRNDY